MRGTPTFLALAVVLQSAACDRLVSPDPDDSRANPAFSRARAGWGTAVALSSIINTAALEGCPNESPDGKSLYFASNRDQQLDIWVSHRDNKGEWGPPEKLEGVNTDADEFCPTALPGGGLMFVSNRSDGQNCGVNTADIYQTRLHPQQGWLEPEHLGCEVNSEGNEFSPSYVGAGGGMLFFSSDQSGKHEIYVSLREPRGSWGTPSAVGKLNFNGFNTVRPNVSADGREIVFDSDRPDGHGGFDVWSSTRATPWADWNPPTNAGDAINSGANETRASLSRDGKRLYFGSNRGGESFDLYVSQRN